MAETGETTQTIIIAPTGDIIPEATSIEELAAQARASILSTVLLGMEMAEQGQPSSRWPYFRGQLDKVTREGLQKHMRFPGESGQNSQQICASNRDPWDQMPAGVNQTGRRTYEGNPSIEVRVDEEGNKYIKIRTNSSAGTDFDQQILDTGIWAINLSEDGQFSGSDKNGGWRELTGEELRQLREIFDDTKERLKAREARRRSRASAVSASNTQ